jgi:predicted acyltransferase (DUF342 family)
MDTSARAQDSNPLSISTIDEDLTITGNVTSKGALHLDGQVQGDVHCVTLVLGENAQLQGSVVAEEVMVQKNDCFRFVIHAVTELHPKSGSSPAKLSGPSRAIHGHWSLVPSDGAT